MLYIKSLEQAVPVFKALGSDIRIRLIQTLLEHQEMNMNELPSSLGITNGALTSHVKKLEESGILAILPEHSGHGNQKVCRINVDKILVDIASNNDSPAEDSYSIDIPIGNYFNYSVYPTCGLSTTDNLIGEVDDPRYFAHPSHVDAKILWFGRGFIDYRIPNMLPPGQKIDRLTLSFEISSEAPGVNSDWPSDISFFLNNTKIGTWTSPGDFGDVHGMFTPDWWFPNWNQYGLLKMLVIDRHGTFIDGCTEYGIFFKIMIPLMKPSFAAMGIYQGMQSWNNFLWPMIVTNSIDKITLPVGLQSLLSPYGNNYDILIAGSCFAIIPILALFVCFQRYFIEGMTAGGVKG